MGCGHRNNDELLKSISQENQSAGKTCAGGTAAGSRRLPVPSLSWQRQKWPWHSTVDGYDRAVPTDWGTGCRPSGSVFKVEYTDCAAACLSTVIQRNAAPAGYGGLWPGEKS